MLKQYYDSFAKNINTAKFAQLDNFDNEKTTEIAEANNQSKDLNIKYIQKQ